MERWVTNKKESAEFLQALASGIELIDGSIVKCSLDPKEIEQAFHNNRLDYKVFAKPIPLYNFLLRKKRIYLKHKFNTVM
ncbi:MAG: hypothetical protein H0T62_12965 [Parachlamydiaceae bacterium]|nr:hypothetical protein [Parachlamydiaceae bacterium]